VVIHPSRPGTLTRQGEALNLVSRLRHPVIREWLIILIILGGLIFAAVGGQWFWRVDQTLYDRAIALLERPADPEVVIIGIDEPSLKQLGRWPWPRNIHATLLDKLTVADARVVVLDIILSEPDRKSPEADGSLAKSIAANGRVVLPITKDVADRDIFDGRVFGEVLPVAAMAAGAAKLAHIGQTPDADGVLRSVFLRAGAGSARFDISPLAALRIADPAKWNEKMALPGTAPARSPDSGSIWKNESQYLIPFAGPPGHFERVPYIDVLRGDAPASKFKGRIVFVGATAPSMRDEFPAPVSGNVGPMAGVEVQANVLQGLREGIDLRLASAATMTALSMALLLLAMTGYLWLTPRISLALTAALGLLMLLASATSFKYMNFWLPPAVPLAALLLAYPLWSWRKLEATQRYFDAELARIAEERIIVPEEIARKIAPAASANAFVPDVIESRIATLQATSQRLRNLNRFVADSLESLPDATLVTDANARVLLANSSADRLFKARRRGVGRENDPPLEGRDLFELMLPFHKADARTWRELWVDAYEETQTISVEARSVAEHEYLVRIAPSFSARGTQTGSILTLVDVTPLRESERRRDEALRFLSHDMRSPQASILTLLDMYQGDPESISTEKLTQRVGRYARRTLTLADDFLRLAKAERANVKDFEPLDLAELVQDAADEAWSSAKGKNIRVEVEIACDEAWMAGDRDLLTRALMNLLSNAIKYSPPNTVVRCALRVVAGALQVEIADQGYGIAETDIPKLFTRFTRLKHDAQPEEAGIGLGLVFVKTVVERHGGNIAVRSRVAERAGEQGGTTFVVTLPATAQEPAQA